MASTSDLSTYEPDLYSAFMLLNLFFDRPYATSSPAEPDSLSCGVAYVTPVLDTRTHLEDMPWRLAHAALCQLHANLLLVMDDDDPEYVHQARIAWRRLRGTSRLIASIPGLPDMPQALAFVAVTDRLRTLRDLDVARLEVLPRASSHTLTQPSMSDAWHALTAALDAEATVQRAALRALLQDAQVGEALWQQVLWLVKLREIPPGTLSRRHSKGALIRWTDERIRDIHHRFKRARARSKDAVTQHSARIWAKRLRYATEDFKGLLDSKSRKWLQEAKKVQSSLGAQRDLLMTAELATQHGFNQLVPDILGLNPKSC